MFKVTKNSKISRARIFELETGNGVLKSPSFLPDATRGFVRAMCGGDLEKSGVEAMVVNTYHLYLQPGIETIRKLGGVHRFMNWEGPLVSDSGGFQVFSLIHSKEGSTLLRQGYGGQVGEVLDEGVRFKSPYDGSMHELTPEKSIQIQFDLGTDIMVCLDDVPPHGISRSGMERSVERTVAWAERCKREYIHQLELREISLDKRPLLLCVVQGGLDKDLRKMCFEGLYQIGERFSAQGGPASGWHGYGFGGRPVDEEGNFVEEILEYTASLIPEDTFRFALGMGTPDDIVRSARMGWDLFDCVIPTREGRHGRLYKFETNSKFEIQNSKFYSVVNITNSQYKDDTSRLDEGCGCELCASCSLGYLHHLFRSGESLAWRLASAHNLKFYTELMKRIRGEIESGEL